MDAYTLQRGVSDALNENLPGPIGDAVCLTKRELFAAMAMQGLSASDAYAERPVEHVAEVAVEQADALLAELAKPVAQEGGQQ